MLFSNLGQHPSMLKNYTIHAHTNFISCIALQTGITLEIKIVSSIGTVLCEQARLLEKEIEEGLAQTQSQSSHKHIPDVRIMQMYSLSIARDLSNGKFACVVKNFHCYC